MNTYWCPCSHLFVCIPCEVVVYINIQMLKLMYIHDYFILLITIEYKLLCTLSLLHSIALKTGLADNSILPLNQFPLLI